MTIQKAIALQKEYKNRLLTLIIDDIIAHKNDLIYLSQHYDEFDNCWWVKTVEDLLESVVSDFEKNGIN